MHDVTLFFSFIHVKLLCFVSHSNDMMSYQSSSAENVSCNVAPFFHHHSVVIQHLVSERRLSLIFINTDMTIVRAETGENQDSCFVQEQKRDRVKSVIHQHIMSVKRHTCPGQLVSMKLYKFMFVEKCIGNRFIFLENIPEYNYLLLKF